MNQMNAETLALVIEGQNERTIMNKSKLNYLSKLRTLSKVVMRNIDLFQDAIVVDENGAVQMHPGQAYGIVMFNIPMDQADVQKIFALISVDSSLAKKRKRVVVVEEDGDEEGVAEDVDEADVDEEAEDDPGNEIIVCDPRDPAKNKITCSAQGYQNFKSALKWWHELTNADLQKVGALWSAEANKKVVNAIASYKLDVGRKKREGIMKDGKSAYSINGYEALCKFFLKMKPIGHRFSWTEGLFGGLFQKFAVNSIGRSDNKKNIL